MKLLVTGAAGYFGGSACRTLVEAGHDVLAVDKTYRRDLPCRLEVVDLLQRDVAYRVVEGRDAVVHLANHPTFRGRDSQVIFNENVSMNMNVFQACREVGVKTVVFASTIQVLSGSNCVSRGMPQPPSPAYLPMDGDMPAIPANPYALSKTVSEQMLRYYVSMGLPCGVAIRFPSLVDEERLGWMREHLGASEGNLREGLAFLPLADAGSLLVHIIAANPPGYRAYFPAAHGTLTGEPARALIEKHFSQVPLRRPLAEIDSLVDVSAITRETGWTPQMNTLG